MFSRESFWYMPILVFCLVLASEIAFLVVVGQTLNHYDASLYELVTKQDSSEYLSLAQSMIADGNFFVHGIPTPETFRSIGFPAIIAVIFLLTGGSTYVPYSVPPDWGDSFYLTLGFLTLVGASTSVVIYATGRALEISRTTSASAGLLFGVSPAVLFLPVSGMGSDMVFVFLFAISLYLLTQLSSEKSWSYASAIGVTMGFATLTRPVGQYFALLIILAIPFFVDPHWLPKFRRSILLSGIALMAFLIVVSPWLIRNYRVGGHFAISSIPPYSFYNYNIPQFLAFHNRTSEAEEQKKQAASIGNPPDKIYRSFTYTDTIKASNREFLNEYFIPYSIFHAIKTIPFFVGSGIDVSYAVIGIETKWQLNIPFLPTVDDNLSNLVYSGAYKDALKNLLKYWPATIERLIWAILFVLALFSPFLTKDMRQRKFFILGLLFVGIAAIMASPVAQPRYRVPVEPFVWISALYSCSKLWMWYTQRYHSRLSS